MIAAHPLPSSYELIWTQDGSPSLLWRDQNSTVAITEAMHHSGGALSESLYIYGQPIQWAFAEGLTKVASVGLGLGYNEFLSFKNESPSLICVHSYEKDTGLVEQFRVFLQTGTGPVYKKILELLTAAELYTDLRERIWQAHQESRLQVRGCLETDSRQDRYGLILYDAFSSKRSPQLWSEDFLCQWLREHAQDRCLFASYACTGALKRALRANGFTLLDRRGFHGKRASTLAFRGLTKSPDWILGIS